MKKLCLCLLTLAFVPFVPAPPAVAQEASLEEASAYQAWFAANAAKDMPKALDLAQAYLDKFPKGQYADYLGKWHTGMQWNLFNEAIKTKDMAEMVRLGEARLKQDPKDVTYLYWMALNLRQNELLGPADLTHAKETADFSRRAAELIEGGAQPAGVDAAKWNKNANLAWLHQNLALVAAKGGSDDESLKEYETSSALAPSDVGIQARNALGSGSIYKDKYDKAVAKYQALPDAERSPESPSPAATQLIDEANANADKAIESWAHFLGVTKGAASEAVRSQMEATLAALYRYRHPDEPEGYKALVDKYAPAP
jgi:hypothetical protein